MENVPEKEEKAKLFLFEAMFILVVGLIVVGAFYFDEIMNYFSK
jgi:disulfide bond formation protein DsbB